MNYAEELEKHRDVYDTIQAVHGEKYARFIIHSLLYTALCCTDQAKDARDLTVAFGCGVLTDLAIAYGIDLEDNALGDDIMRDVKSFGLLPPQFNEQTNNPK